VTVRSQAVQGPLGLGAAAWSQLDERVGHAIARARRERRQVLAAVSAPVPAEIDLSAAVLAARGSGDRFFCLEQPGFALATLGQAAIVEAEGVDRFVRVAAACRELAHAEDDGGSVWVGGFAFAAAGGSSPEWASLAPAQMVMPEIALSRRGDGAQLTVSAVLDGDESADAVLDRLRARVDSLEPAPMPLLDPDPLVTPRVAGATPPEHFESAVARGVERIRSGELDKLVLAREVRVHAPDEIDPAPVFDALRAAFPACYCYLVGTPELAFIGASPELLVRREGARAQTVALAGTTRRSADPSVDDLLGEQLLRSEKQREEQAIVTRRIERTLRPVSVWVAAADEPVLVKVQNVQHLATPIRAQLAEPESCIELAGRLHPTPAVGGEPREVAAKLIPALEGLDRGWYAGTVGWSDLSEDGEFCVAIRCALIRGRVAHLYAGNGIVRDSVPADELAETEVKLQALLPLLA
jgi:isochorismate synthase